MQGEDFLSENNVAGQTILRLVSRGNAIVAELLRLSDNIPPPFIVPPLDKRKSVAKRPYDDVIFDFKYLKNQELYDTRIETTPELSDLDVEFRDAHIDILRRFYQLFESVYKYITDFLKYIEDMEEGVFIQQTLEVRLSSTPLVLCSAPSSSSSYSLFYSSFSPLPPSPGRLVEPGRPAALRRGRLPVRHHALPARPAHRRRGARAHAHLLPALQGTPPLPSTSPSSSCCCCCCCPEAMVRSCA